MTQQKLYTEEQVRWAFRNAHIYAHLYEVDENKFMGELVPIELPTDEEIKEALFHYSNEYAIGFKDGIEYIKQKYK